MPTPFDLVTGGLGPTRRRVLSALQASGEPVPIETLSEQLGLHANTLRFHLASLVADGLAASQVQSRGAKGRPRALYSATPESPAVDGVHYQELAAVLVRHFAAAHDDSVAHDLGFEWGRSVAEEADRDGDPLQQVNAAMNSVGFTCTLTPDRARLEVTRCPYRQLTMTGDRTVCRIHLGMMRGYLESLGAAETVESLEPWVTDELCVATVGRAIRSGVTPPPG